MPVCLNLNWLRAARALEYPLPLAACLQECPDAAVGDFTFLILAARRHVLH